MLFRNFLFPNMTAQTWRLYGRLAKVFLFSPCPKSTRFSDPSVKNDRIGVLFSDSILSFESVLLALLSKALELRGAQVVALLPGYLFIQRLQVLSSISRRKTRQKWWSVLLLIRLCRLPYIFLSDLLSPDDLKQIKEGLRADVQFLKLSANGLNINTMAERHAKLMIYSYNPEKHPDYGQFHEWCKNSILLTFRAACRVFEKLKLNKIMAFNGLYLFNETVLQVARHHDLKTDTCEVAIRPHSVIFAHGPVPAVLYPYDRLWDQWSTIPLTAQERKTISAYMLSRMQGLGQHTVIFHASVDESRLQREMTRLNLLGPAERMLISVNVPWDTTVLNRQACFPSMAQWIVQTVKQLMTRDNCQVLIKPHPFIEMMPWQAQSLETFIQSRLGRLPEHIKIIDQPRLFPNRLFPPFIQKFVVYNSSSALELAYLRKRPIVTADTYFSGKGFTLDPSSPEEYFHYLDAEDPPDLSDTEYEQLLRYLFFLFFRINLTTRINCIGERITYHAPKWLHSLRDLMPGRESNLDIICNGILNDTEFINTSRIEYL